MYRIAIDVGGTFTDFSLLRESDGTVFDHKVPSTPNDPSIAIEQGLVEMMAAHDAKGADLSHFAHGTTVATNMLIERRGASTALLTTKGFRDVLEIGRQTRPSLYDYTIGRPPPLVRRMHRLQIGERVDVTGGVLLPLVEGDVMTAISRLRDQQIEAVAICFLHAYRNPVHEQRARELVAEQLPDAYVCTSSEINPEFREFERASTTVANAYVGPRVAEYMRRLQGRVAQVGLLCEPFTFQSNGGLMSVVTARTHPVRTCLSGPAGGVVGAAALARRLNAPGVVTFDVGGTSTDVSLVIDGEPSQTHSRAVGGVPVRTAMIDVHVIGAGGGSIAQLDDAGALKVGPHSAGADPGPVAYGIGGRAPTVTDAAIVTAQLNPVALLDGRMPVDASAARNVIADTIAGPLGIAPEAAAIGVLDIAIANIARAIRTVSVERGFEPASLSLMAFGGAGPLLAARLAEEVGCERVVVPLSPGTSCARGILTSDVRFDFVRSLLCDANASGWRTVTDVYAELARQGRAALEKEGHASAAIDISFTIDARYRGQSFELPVPVDASLLESGEEGRGTFVQQFEAVHAKVHGYDIPERVIEIVNCRMSASRRRTETRVASVTTHAREGSVERREVYFGAAHGWCDTSIYRRTALPFGTCLEGPVVIEEMSTTTVVPPHFTLRVDEHGNLIIETAPRVDLTALADTV